MNHFKMGDSIPIKNKNVLIFSLYYRESRDEYLAMNYYALKTLLEKTDTRNFDIIVFYSLEKEKDLINYNFLKDFNLIKDFQDVIFIKTKYKDDPYMSKWYNIEKVFQYNYEKVLYSDIDVVFLKNPNTLFEYPENKTFCIFENGYIKRNELILKRKGIQSSLVLIPRENFIRIDNFFEKVVKKRVLLNDLGKKIYEEGKINKKEYTDHCFFSEQYAGLFVFLDHNIVVDELNHNWKETILHYGHGLFFKYLPEEFNTETTKSWAKKYQKEE